MSRLSLKRLIAPVILFSLVMPLSVAQSSGRSPVPVQQKGNPHRKSGLNKKVNSPPSIGSVKKAAEKKKIRQKQDYAKYVKENQQKSIKIQTPEVRERMKQNIKDSNSSYNSKHKNTAARTRKAGKKYR
jgi:hypothetical protein